MEGTLGSGQRGGFGAGERWACAQEEAACVSLTLSGAEHLVPCSRDACVSPTLS